MITVELSDDYDNSLFLFEFFGSVVVVIVKFIYFLLCMGNKSDEEFSVFINSNGINNEEPPSGN